MAVSGEETEVQRRRGLMESATGRNALLLIGSSIMLLAGTVAVIYASGSYSGDSALWFIGFILISLSGLSMTAAVFRGLGYSGSPGEAFGLPSGSIRAILAIAIMVLLLIFGLPLISTKGPAVLDRATFANVTIDCSAVAGEVKRYDALHILAVVDTRNCATPAIPGQKASIALHGNVPLNMSGEQREQAKQLITAIITLLTTIIGFYFGSQNALSLVKAIKPSDGGSQSTPSSGNGSGKTLPQPQPQPTADDGEDGCPSDAEPQPGETIVPDQDLPPADGGVEPAAGPQTK